MRDPTAGAGREPARAAQKWLNWFHPLRLFWITLTLVLVVYTQTEFLQPPSGGDRANWDYMAQVIVRGGVPYRDAVNIKTPLSAYLGAAAILITKPFGLRDIVAIRIASILLTATTVALTFLVTLEYFGDLRIGSLVAAIMFTFDSFLIINIGVQPKTPILFGLLTLSAISKDRPLEAGLMGMLSALSWQPGLLFVGAAGLAFSRYLTSWRDMKAVKVIAGASIPLLVTVGHFWTAGALREFICGTSTTTLRCMLPGKRDRL